LRKIDWSVFLTPRWNGQTDRETERGQTVLHEVAIVVVGLFHRFKIWLQA